MRKYELPIGQRRPSGKKGSTSTNPYPDVRFREIHNEERGKGERGGGDTKVSDGLCEKTKLDLHGHVR